MQIIGTEAGIAYGLLGAPDASSMADLLGDVFSRFEPMAVAVGLPRAQQVGLVAALTPKALSERLSIVARDVSTGQLVGALLADDFGTPPPSDLEHVAPGFAPVGALLDSLDEQYRATTPVAPGTHAHIFMVGVAQAAASRGIARHLIESCITHATRLGYRMAVTEATGSASQHVFRKLGFSELFSVTYRDFTFGGSRVFSGIQGVSSALLMVRSLEGHQQPPHGGSQAV